MAVIENQKNLTSNIRDVELKQSDWAELRNAIYVLDEAHNWKNEKEFKKIWRILNKYDYGADKKGKVCNWEKGFREGANHSFNYFWERLNVADKYDKQNIKELDTELKDRVKIAIGKNRTDSVLNEK